MVASVSQKCQACIATLTTTASTLAREKGRVHHGRVNDELGRFILWMGNIGALHGPESSMSLESRLRESKDVLTYILELLDDLDEVARELLETSSGEREGGTGSVSHDADDEIPQNEDLELLDEIGACIARLFRVSRLIRQAASEDPFTKSLSRNRYQFNDQFDISHVGEKYPKLATKEFAWLRNRLGRAITQRRHYLSYTRGHREKLEGALPHEEPSGNTTLLSQAPTKGPQTMKASHDSPSQPATDDRTKATSLPPGNITPQMLTMEEESDTETDARSYTTISRSVDGDLDCSITDRVPKLDQLQRGTNEEVECPFCFRMKKFKNERVWRWHVLSDLRPYVCTFPDCHVPYFGDINEWFRHEMQNHRVSYICRLCEGKAFQLEERYLLHVRKRHPDILEDGEERTLLDIARKPLDHIPAHECPCCSDWVDRLEKRAAVVSMPCDSSNYVLSVVPNVFKRHLASHLEQLALFAIPIKPNIAIVEEESMLPMGSDRTNGDLDSSRPPFSTSGEQPFSNTLDFSDFNQEAKPTMVCQRATESDQRCSGYVQSTGLCWLHELETQPHQISPEPPQIIIEGEQLLFLEDDPPGEENACAHRKPKSEGHDASLVDSDTYGYRQPETDDPYQLYVNTFVASNFPVSFSPENDFVNAIVKRFATEAKHRSAKLGVSVNYIPGIVKLGLYDFVILCDFNTITLDRILILKHILLRLLNMSLTGISIRFVESSVDSRGDFDYLKTAEQIENRVRWLQSQQPAGESKIGTILNEKIVQPMVIEKAQKRTLSRPIITIIITNGEPSGEDRHTLKNTIRAYKESLVAQSYGKAAAVFLIAQLGNNIEAKNFIKELENDEALKDMLYCSPIALDEQKQALQQRGRDTKYTEWLVKLLLAALDSQTIS